MVAVGNRTVTFRAGDLSLCAPRPGIVFAEGSGHAVVYALKVEIVIAGAESGAATLLYLAPAVTDGTDSAIEAIQCVVRSDQYIGGREHFRSDGELGEIVSGLWVDQGGAADAKAGVFKNAATNGDITLCLCHIAGLEVDAGIKFQVGNRGIIGAHGHDVRCLLTVHR